MCDEDFIVSKTDAKGRIAYSNRIFMEFAGYAEHELLGVQHNIVRHPDMPRAVFKVMWETLQAGWEFFGYIKNLASDGSYCWTFANVTPTRDGRGTTIGHYSVRRKPHADGIRYFSALYADMLTKGREAGPRSAIDVSRRLLEDACRNQAKGYEESVLAL